MKKEISIGEIVANDYRAAAVFKEAGIDFCCGGKQSIDEVCSEKGIDRTDLIAKLAMLESTPNTTTHNVHLENNILFPKAIASTN